MSLKKLNAVAKHVMGHGAKSQQPLKKVKKSLKSQEPGETPEEESQETAEEEAQEQEMGIETRKKSKR
jgi:hypothetical protein